MTEDNGDVMKKFKVFNSTIKELWQMFIVLVVPIICVTGGTAIPYTLRLPLTYIVAATTMFIIVFSNVTIRVNKLIFMGLALVVYIGVSILYSYDVQSTVYYFWLYLCYFTLLFIDLPDDYYRKIISICYVICAVIAFSILISTVINNCMLNYFWFITNPSRSPAVAQQILDELKNGAYSGFAGEKGEAAYIMNVGIAIVFAKYFSQNKVTKVDIGMLIVFILALMLTGKRLLFVIMVVAFALFMMISNVKSKFFKVLCVLLLVLFGLFFVIMFLPKVSNIFTRFLDSENLETMSGREELWDYLYLMIDEFPVFGGGMGSYNAYAYDHGLWDERWMFNGHNSYLQVLAELGIVGAAIFALFVILAFAYTIKAIKKFENNKNILYICYFSLYIQVLLVVYSLTGNPVYTRQIMFLWFFSVGCAQHIYRRYVPIARPGRFVNIRKGRVYE